MKLSNFESEVLSFLPNKVFLPLKSAAISRGQLQNSLQQNKTPT